jgi:beta-lactamase regulating signal transducer with metallopeptidase domain
MKDAYPNWHLGGYSVAMPVEASETFFSPVTLLWLVVSAIAAAVLFGAINRRRSHLTRSLRDYVDRNQEGREAIRAPRDETSDN